MIELQHVARGSESPEANDVLSSTFRHNLCVQTLCRPLSRHNVAFANPWDLRDAFQRRQTIHRPLGAAKSSFRPSPEHVIPAVYLFSLFPLTIHNSNHVTKKKTPAVHNKMSSNTWQNIINAAVFVLILLKAIELIVTATTARKLPATPPAHDGDAAYNAACKATHTPFSPFKDPGRSFAAHHADARAQLSPV
jgi:hypothetical protein